MDDFDIPIFKKAYELYKTFYSYRKLIPKEDRYTIWQQCDVILLEILEGLLEASQSNREEKIPILRKVSTRLNFLRVFIRLMKETKTLDNKKYATLQEQIDEIGRMLGGWIRFTKEH